MIIGKIYEISEVTKLIKNAIENKPELWNIQVRGEIYNFKRYPSGHCYFTLKDKNSVIKSVMFKTKANKLNFIPKNGDKIIAIGRISVYESSGNYQLYIDLMFEDGLGPLQVEYELLKKNLESKGYFDEKNKKKIPENFKTLGVITSDKGAAIHDIISVSKNRNPGIKIILYPVKVQGKESAKEIAHAIKFMNKNELADVLIVGRGGGSMEDLWPFNEEIVVKSIFDSKIPIISAVGHEIDYTLSDFVADKRAATPSNGAELAIKDMLVNFDNLKSLSKKNINSMLNIIKNAKYVLQISIERQSFYVPDKIIEAKKQKLDLLYYKLNNNMQKSLQVNINNYKILNEKLDVLSPLSILKRGYSVVTDQSEGILTSINNIEVNEKINVRLNNGKLKVLVLDTKKVEDFNGF